MTREKHLSPARQAVMLAPLFPGEDVNRAMLSSAAPLTVDASLSLELERAIDGAREALLAQQRADGHWVYELEADATIPAEYILLQHYLGEIDAAEEQRIACYLRAIQGRALPTAPTHATRPHAGQAARDQRCALAAPARTTGRAGFLAPASRSARTVLSGGARSTARPYRDPHLCSQELKSISGDALV